MDPGGTLVYGNGAAFNARESAVKSLDRAMSVLMSFSTDQRDFGVSELSERLDLPKSQISKVLATLRTHGLVTQSSGTRRYSVGLRAFALGGRYLKYSRLCQEALSVMHTIVRETGHSARFSVRDQDDALFLIALEGPHFFDTGWRAGTWLPWHSSSAARVMLAFLTPEDATALLDNQALQSITAYTVTDRTRLDEIVETARRRGYDAQRNEMTIGLGTLSVPVFGPYQVLLGSLSLAFPSNEVEPGSEAGYVAAMHAKARVLSTRMGCVVYPF